MMDESIEAFLSMSPYDKNVVNKSLPDSWCWSVSVYKLVFKLWHAFCTFIQDVRGRYKMSESETRFEKFSVNMKNWTQHEVLDATWKNGHNMTEREPTCGSVRSHNQRHRKSASRVCLHLL